TPTRWRREPRPTQRSSTRSTTRWRRSSPPSRPSAACSSPTTTCSASSPTGTGSRSSASSSPAAPPWPPRAPPSWPSWPTPSPTPECPRSSPTPRPAPASWTPSRGRVPASRWSSCSPSPSARRAAGPTPTSGWCAPTPSASPPPWQAEAVDWLLEPFDPEFMRRALAAGMLAVLASSTVGTWVVLRGLTFRGDALAHGVVPGMALAVLWGFDVTIGALVTAALMVGGITLVSRRARLHEDTGVGLLFVGMLALGVVIISKSRSFATDVQTLLFGDVLGVTDGDLRLQVVAAVIV